MSRFRFRDPTHLEDMLSFNQDSAIGAAGHTHTDTDYSSSVSSVDGDVDSDLQSMTAKGISHFCSELMELRNEADEDFQKSVFSNYSAFLKVFEEMEGLESELMELKYHTSTQKMLINVLMERLSVNDSTEHIVESMLDEDLASEQLSQSILEAHKDDVSEIMDTLLSEHRLDEAISTLEMEARTFQSMDFGENFTSDELMSYKSAISEKRGMLVDRLVTVAENPRVSAPELQKALVGILKFGDVHLATRLLFNYYHARITRGMQNLYSWKLSSPEVYCRELAKFVFSMISQAEKSFVALHGEVSSYGSDLAQWASEETEYFARCLDKYIRSITEITDGLSTAVEAVQFALLYCSLLEYQKNVIRECLISNLRPTLDQVFQLHIDHYKKVINICTLTDTWVLGRFLVSGILSKEGSFTKNHTKPEYCLLTNSGRKFVTLFQAVTNDSLPLVSLQMENSICRGLIDLFVEYTVMLQKALASFARKEDGSENILVPSLVQGVSIIANSSTLVPFFFDIVGRDFEIDDHVPFIQEAHNRLRAHFFEQVLLRYFSPESDPIHDSDHYVSLQDDQDFSSLEPSALYQEFFLQLRKVQKFAEDNCIQQEWLVDLLRQLMEFIFVSISSKNDLIQMPPIYMKQLILDIHFLEENAKCGGYWSENIMNATSDVASHIYSVLGATEFALESQENWLSRSREAAIVALQKLEEVDEKESATSDISNYLEEETKEYESPDSSDLFEEDEDDNDPVSSKQTIDSPSQDSSHLFEEDEDDNDPVFSKQTIDSPSQDSSHLFEKDEDDNDPVSSKQTIDSPSQDFRIVPALRMPSIPDSYHFEENNLDDGKKTNSVNPGNSVPETNLQTGKASEATEEEISNPTNFKEISSLTNFNQEGLHQLL